MSLQMIFSKPWKGVFMEYVGNSKVISINEVELPPLGTNGILIEVKACGISNSKLKFHLPLFSDKVTGIGLDIAGVVLAIGSDVTSLVAGDHVAGIVPLDCGQSGCSNFVVLQEHDVVIKPDRVSFVDAAGCIGDAMKAFVALHYLGNVKFGDTVFVFDGASSFGSICIQYARLWGARVLTTSSSEDEMCYLKSLCLYPHDVFDLTEENFDLVESIMAETCKIGVDAIIDCISSSEIVADTPDNGTASRNFSTHDIISCLAVGGRWITTKSDLQLDPPSSHLLYLRCASVCYLFEHAIRLVCTKQGKYLHMMRDIMQKVSSRIIQPNIHHTITFDSGIEALQAASESRVGKVVMTM